MTVTFRNNSTPFTVAFNVAPGATYHLLDTYAPLPLAAVSAYVATLGGLKNAAIATRLKNTLKRGGVDAFVANYGALPYTGDDAARASTLPGVWSSKLGGHVNLVCIPLTRGEFAAAVDLGGLDNPPTTLTGLLVTARGAIISGGYDALRSATPSDGAFAIVDRLAPRLADGVTPSTGDLATAGDTVTPETGDTPPTAAKPTRRRGTAKRGA